jgi:hypothetical protein
MSWYAPEQRIFERIKACLSTKMFKPSHLPIEAPQEAEWGREGLVFFRKHEIE